LKTPETTVTSSTLERTPNLLDGTPDLSKLNDAFIDLCKAEIKDLNKSINYFQKMREKIHSKLISSKHKVVKEEQADLKTLLDRFANSIKDLRDRKFKILQLIQQYEQDVQVNIDKKKFIKLNIFSGYTKVAVSLLAFIVGVYFAKNLDGPNWVLGYILISGSLASIGLSFTALGKVLRDLKDTYSPSLNEQHKEFLTALVSEWSIKKDEKEGIDSSDEEDPNT